MNGLIFEERPPVAASAPNRADVACFVGFVERRKGAPLPASIRAWLEAQGWIPEVLHVLFSNCW